MSSIRSASSRTKNDTLLMSTFPSCMCEIRRPGVAIITSAPSFSDLSCYDLVLRKAELWNTILKHSTRTVKGLEYSHFISELCEVRSTSKSGRATI